MSGPYEHPYWNLLLRAVVRGELYAAWTLLSHHSAVGEEGGLHEISPDAEGFAALHAILLSAPIPGGRGEENDDNYSRQIDGEVDYVNDVSIVNGITPGANLLWESNPRGAHRLQQLMTSQSILLPEM